MEIDINKIASSSDLDLNVQKIKNKLKEKSEIIIFDNNFPQFVIISLENYMQIKHAESTPSVDISNASDVKIGKYVQENMRRLFYDNKLSEDEIVKLTSQEYSSEIFNLNFPVLKLYNPAVSFDEQKRDLKGYNRYYSFTLTAFQKQYLLCSQWVEYLHRTKFETWLSIWL